MTLHKDENRSVVTEKSTVRKLKETEIRTGAENHDYKQFTSGPVLRKTGGNVTVDNIRVV